MALALVLAGLALTAVGTAAWSGRLRRNRWVGVRTPAAMSCDEAFALANRVAGPSTLTAGLLLVLAAGGRLGLDGVEAVVIVVLGVAGAVGMLIAGGGLGSRAATALTAHDLSAQPPARCVGCTGCALRVRQ